MSIIAAGTTTTTALSSTGNTDGTLQLQVNGTTPSVTLNTLGAVGVGSTPAFGTAGQVLTSGGSTVAPSWAAPAAVNLASGVTGTLPIANGGTNSTATPTAGTIPYGTGTALAYTAAGSSGQVLTSAGAGTPTWSTPSSGAMTLISTTTASSSSTVDITSGFTSTYDMYMVVITNMTVSATSSAAFWAQMYIGGSLQTSLYSYNYGFMDTGGFVTSGFTTSSPGDSRMYLAASGIIAQVGAPRTINAVFYIPNPSSTSVNKYMYGSGTTASATGGFRSYNFFTTAGYIGTGAMTGVSFYIQSGTIVTGKFRLYGISN